MAARYRWNDCVLDLDAFRLERNGVAVPLEPKAFNLLALLVGRPGHLFTKQEIFEALWRDTAVTDHALTRVVAQLRRGLGDEAREARYIETVPTRGYRWIARVEECAPALGRRARGPALAAGLGLALTMLVLLAWAARSSTTKTIDAPVLAAPSSDSLVGGPVQLTTHAGLDLHPALSPKGDAMAFASDRSGTFEIYVRGLGGTSSDTRLTSDEGQNVQPAWSPDGRFIAFHSYRRGGVWVIPSRGGVARQVAASGSRPAWSPDGRLIAFQSDEHADVAPTGFAAQAGSSLWLVDIEGGRPRPLTRSDRPVGGHAAPAWSRSGRFIAFSVFEAGAENGIWTVDVGSGETRLLEAGVGLFESVFAPDDTALYVAGGNPFIVRLPFDAAAGTMRAPRQVIPMPGVPGVRAVTMDSEGRRLGVAGLSLDSQIWLQRVDPTGVSSGDPVALTSDTSRRNSVPVVSPDGSRVAYMSARRGEMSNVWVIGVDGQDPIQVTSHDAAEHKPLWHRDGRRIAYSSLRDRTLGFWTVDVETRREEPLFAMPAGLPMSTVPGKVAEVQLSPSQTRVAFATITAPAARRRLFVTGTDPFAPVAIGPAGVSAGYPAWSPDETRIAVEVKSLAEQGAPQPADGSVHAGIIDARTGALRMLTSDRGQTWVRSWSPDGRRIAVASLRDGAWSLRWIDVETGAQGDIVPPGPPRVYVRYPEWSPRGDVIVFERGEMRGNIWTVALPGT